MSFDPPDPHHLTFLLRSRLEHIQKILVDAGIVAQLGMEGCGQRFTLAHEHGLFPIAFGGDDIDFSSQALDFGGADEDHFGGAALKLAFADGAVELASIGIAADGDVERAETRLRGIFHFGGEKDGAGAGSEGGLGLDEELELFESGFA